MGIFSNLFGKKKPDKNASSDPKDAAAGIIREQQAAYQQKVQSKESSGKVSENELTKLYLEYFAPNKDFYSVLGSPKFQAYFQVVNAARDEMFQNPQLFSAATKWTVQELVDLVNNPKPMITNLLVCGLIFKVGDYAVIRDALYCVDFCEAVPNCIALYLLLTAQKLPADKRKMFIDAGDGSDSTALSAAMETLKTCDPDWSFTIG